MTLVVNFFAGPGTGKSTTTALVFGELKMDGYNIEIAPEYAKDVVWEKRPKPLQHQPYVLGKQYFRVARLIGEVQAVLTDSPILLSIVYDKQGMPESFSRFALDLFKRWNTLNIFLERDLDVKPYNPKGRNQELEEALQVDNEIYNLLTYNSIPFTTVKMSENTAVDCSQLVRTRLAQ